MLYVENFYRRFSLKQNCFHVIIIIIKNQTEKNICMIVKNGIIKHIQDMGENS